MRHTTILPVVLILAACAPAQAVPTLTPVAPTDAPTVTVTLAPTATSTREPTSTPTIEPTATATKHPTATLVALPADLAAQVDKLSEAQKTSLMGKAEDTAWKLAVYDRIREGSPNFRLILGVWENPAVKDDVEVVYKLPSDPSVIYLPGTKLWADRSLPPAEITQEMMKNQEVVGKYILVVSEELEKTSSIPAGSKLARVNGDLVYLSEEGVEAKLNVDTDIFEQQVVRDNEGWTPLENGTKVKLANIKKIPNNGTFVFSQEPDGTQPFPDVNYQLPILPDGYEYTAATFIAYNPLGNSMASWSKNGTSWFKTPEPKEYKTKSLRSDDNDQWARLVVIVPHRIGNDLEGIGVIKTEGGINHVVFRADDPFTKDLIPQ